MFVCAKPMWILNKFESLSSQGVLHPGTGAALRRGEETTEPCCYAVNEKTNDYSTTAEVSTSRIETRIIVNRRSRPEVRETLLTVCGFVARHRRETESLVSAPVSTTAGTRGESSPRRGPRPFRSRGFACFVQRFCLRACHDNRGRNNSVEPKLDFLTREAAWIE